MLQVPVPMARHSPSPSPLSRAPRTRRFHPIQAGFRTQELP